MAGLLAAPATATPPTPASGTILVIGLSVTSVRTEGSSGNTFVTGLNTLAVSGTISGAATYAFTQLNHPSGAFNSSGIVTCTPCTVGSSTGTLVARVEGTGALGPPITFAGNATILSATGGLAGLHGEITFSQVGPVLTYSGSVHFEP